jgi:hypothetical protein
MTNKYAKAYIHHPTNTNLGNIHVNVFTRPEKHSIAQAIYTDLISPINALGMTFVYTIDSTRHADAKSILDIVRKHSAHAEPVFIAKFTILPVQSLPLLHMADEKLFNNTMELTTKSEMAGKLHMDRYVQNKFLDHHISRYTLLNDDNIISYDNVTFSDFLYPFPHELEIKDKDNSYVMVIE